MIELSRTRNANSITAKLTGAELQSKLVELVQAEIERQNKIAAAPTQEEKDQIRNSSRKFNDRYWGFAKLQLKKEANAKCAYCESKTRPGAVEHFRPKGIYWWLAYCYDNYTYSCTPCNSSKGSKFPLGQNVALPSPLPAFASPNPTNAEIQQAAALLCPDPLDDPAVQTWLGTLITEQGLLINPYFMDPEPFFEWVLKPQSEAVEIKARGVSAAVTAIADAAISVCGLNNEDLQRERWLRVEDLQQWKELLDVAISINSSPLRNLARRNLRRLMHPKQAFAGMSRYIVRDLWGLDINP